MPEKLFTRTGPGTDSCSFSYLLGCSPHAEAGHALELRPRGLDGLPVDPLGGGDDQDAVLALDPPEELGAGARAGPGVDLQQQQVFQVTLFFIRISSDSPEIQCLAPPDDQIENRLWQGSILWMATPTTC